jgi:titin
LAALIAGAGGLVVSAAPAAAATFTVTSTADSGAGSLRQAITSANALAGPDDITLAIPGGGSKTISVTSAPLPVVTGRLKIDGATQPGFAGTPLVRIDNGTGTSFTDGLEVTVGSSQVLSLSITGFGAGVVLRTGATNTVAGNRIGLAPSGAADGNTAAGVVITDGSRANTIGGTTAAARNIISANGEGIVIIGASNANKLLGNLVGVAPGGGSALGNTNAGIRIADGSKNNVVGGTTAGAGNVISGNGGGMNINGAGTTGTVVAGNRIGTNPAGTASIPNRFFGIGILGAATGTTIGGTTTAARNLISGNTGVSGVSIGGPGTSGNVVAGNFVGTTASGGAALPNGDGVTITNGATGNTVGGDRATARNLLSGNASSGVTLSGIGTNDNVVAGNDIGVDRAGTTAVPNIRGVFILFGSAHNTVGGSTAARRNVISGNTFHGVDVELDGADANRISGNYIGTTPSGATAVPNGFTGIQIAGGPAGTVVGGSGSGERNVISGNSGAGVTISGAPSSVVSANDIGMAAGGNAPLGNGTYGVLVSGADSTGNRIGGTTAGQRNVISANLLGGIRLTNQATGTLVQGNLVGTAANGLSPIANAGDGVAADNGASASTIGGTASAANTIAFNGGDGVSVNGDAAPTNGIAILRNAISGNAQLGIALQNGGNDDQVAPVITSVTTTDDTTTIKATLTGAAPSTAHRIEAFVSAACDGSGAGEGARFIGSATVATNAAGDRAFTLNVRALAAGQVVTATATRNTGPVNTSPFSACATT